MAEIKNSTQDHLDIEDIQDDLVIMKTGSVALVLETTAVNFDLLSEVEQDAMISAYGHLLNSLSFAIQVIIRSKKMDVTTYLQNLINLEEKQTNPFVQQKIKEYRSYISELVSKNEVLDKRFYVIIPYQEILLTSSGSGDPLSFLFGTKKKTTINKRAILEKAKIDLKPKKEQLIKQFSGIGLRVRQLTTQELVELFYDIYNPDSAREQKMRLGSEDYTAYFVEPAVGG